MARLVQLGVLLTDLRAELTDTTSPALGLTDRAILIRQLQSTQNYFYGKYPWPFLKVWEYQNISAGQRYYSVPSALAVDRIYEVRHLWGNLWSDPIDKGISLSDYNAYNSNDDVRADPIQRWDIKSISGTAQIEIWPLPASNQTSALGIVGKRECRALQSDADTCDIDSELLIKWTAARILKRRKSAEWTGVKEEADDILRTLLANVNKSANRYSFSQAPDTQPERLLRVVPVN